MRTKKDVFDDLSREKGEAFVNAQMKLVAEFLWILSDDQAKAAAKLDENTRTLVSQTETLIAAAKLAETSNRRIVRLTWALLVVTIGVLALTAVLCSCSR